MSAECRATRECLESCVVWAIAILTMCSADQAARKAQAVKEIEARLAANKCATYTAYRTHACYCLCCANATAMAPPLLLHTAATLALAMAPDSAAPHLLLPLAYLLPFRAWSRSLEEKSPGYFNKLVGLEAPEVLW
jgi:hypothetical protein